MQTMCKSLGVLVVSLLPLLVLFFVEPWPSVVAIVVQSDDLSFDSWLHTMAVTSSPFAIQPKKFNGKGGHKKARRLPKTIKPSIVDNSSPAPTTPRVIVVDRNGSSDFTTIQEAVNSIPLSNAQRVIIKIRPGVYR